MTTAQQVREQVSMLDVLERCGLEPPARSDEGKIPCIFHDDRTPSLHVYEDHWWSYCCNKGGSVIDFVMGFYGCSFGKALQFLAMGTDELAPARVERRRREEADLTDRFRTEHRRDDLIPEVDAWVRRTWPFLNWHDLLIFGVKPVGHAIWIPHPCVVDDDEKVTGIKVRAVGSGAKSAVKGSRFTKLYHQGYRNNGKVAVLVEGESDTWCMHKAVADHGIDVYGLPSGAGSWRTEMIGELPSYETIFTAFDLDPAGDAATEKVRNDLGRAGKATQQLFPPGGRVAEAFGEVGWDPLYNTV